jgi:L-asparagine transporter-like permease
MTIMYFIKIYFVLALPVVLIVLWDYRKLAVSAKRLTKPPQDKGSQFSRIALETRNWLVMLLFAFFLWPLVVLMELFGKREE